MSTSMKLLVVISPGSFSFERAKNDAVLTDAVGEGSVDDVPSSGDGPVGEMTSCAEKSQPPSDRRRANRIASPGVCAKQTTQSVPNPRGHTILQDNS